MRLAAFITLTLLTLIAAPCVNAAISWENTVYKQDANHGDEKSVAVFKFSNTGSNPVTITSIHSSCGCTTANLSKRQYAPGESGEIKAIFTYGIRTGKQHKVITVESSENGNKRKTMLELFVNIPETATMEPRVQYWPHNSAKDAKPIIVKITEGFPGKPISAKLYSKKTNFKISEPEEIAPRTYQISVEPMSTSEKLTEAGEVLVENPGKDPIKLLFYLSVR